MSDESKNTGNTHLENQKPRKGLRGTKKYDHERELALQEALIREQKLLEISRILNDGIDLQETLEKITAQSSSLLNADAATLDVHSADGKALYYPVSYQLSKALASLRHLPRGEDLSWEKIESGQSLMINDYPSSSKARQEMIDANVQGILGVPLKAGKHCLGSLVFYRFDDQKPFNELDLVMAEHIAMQTGREIQNRLLFKEVERLRGVDPITRLYSQHLFSDLAQHDVERVFRYGSFLSVIMVEIDNLVQIESFYGEGTMNQVLGEVAQMCRTKLRTSDVLGRFGQNRILFLLPEADKHKAQLTAERIRREIEAAVFNTDSGPINLTASLGIASNKRGRKIDAEKLIRRSEQVLAAAICSGRNQIAVWNPDPEDY